MSKKHWKTFYTLAFILGFALMLVQVRIFRLTFISGARVTFFLLIATVISYFVLRKHYSSVYGTDKLFFPFVQSLFSFGFIITASFMILNYVWANDSQKKTYQFNILKVGELAGRGHVPYAEIMHRNQVKAIIFKSNQMLSSDQKLKLTTCEGFLGYEVILEKEILEE